jgi:hypothetical protein
LLFISAGAALFVAAPAALAITRRVFHRWHQYRAGELPYALLAGLLQPVKEPASLRAGRSGDEPENSRRRQPRVVK